MVAKEASIAGGIFFERAGAFSRSARLFLFDHLARSSKLTLARVRENTTTTIPIVFSTGGDPVAFGFAASLNGPGANLTGSAT
jgi:hypothetical protein